MNAAAQSNWRPWRVYLLIFGIDVGQREASSGAARHPGTVHATYRAWTAGPSSVERRWLGDCGPTRGPDAIAPAGNRLAAARGDSNFQPAESS